LVKKEKLERVDYIIVGQGLAGSLLSWELLQRGKQILVIDPGKEQTASKKAAGLYNPITGRKMVKTWLADDLFPGLEKYYHSLESEFNAKFIFPKTIYRPFHSHEEQNDWHGKVSSNNFSSFVEDVKINPTESENVLDPYGGIVLKRSGYVDLPKFLKVYRNFLTTSGKLSNEMFHYEDIKKLGSEVSYRGLLTKKIIFCEGSEVRNNPFFKELKFRVVKGELLNLKIDLPLNQILNRGVFMIPKENLTQVGSTYDHDDLTWETSTKGKVDILERLGKIYSGRKEVVSQLAGIRPATFDRRPFLGLDKNRPYLGIFNGLGAKGVSLAPFFSQKMADFLVDGRPLPEEVRLNR